VNSIWKIKKMSGEYVSNFSDIAQARVEHLQEICKKYDRETLVEVVHMNSFIPIWKK
jgi:hypothetical protein